MANKHFRTFQELYYDGEVDYCDERYVSPEMKQGIYDCVEYIENESLNDDYLWYKQEAQKKYYREPYKPEEKAMIN